MNDRDMLNNDMCPVCEQKGVLSTASDNLQKIGIRKICSVCSTFFRY